MIMLCALRDSAVQVGGADATALVDAINDVLMSRPSKLQHPEGQHPEGQHPEDAEGSEGTHTRNAAVGLDGLVGAESVRLIPSRAVRLRISRSGLDVVSLHHAAFR